MGTFVSINIDRSGSMLALEQATVDALNAYLDRLREDENADDISVSIAQWDACLTGYAAAHPLYASEDTLQYDYIVRGSKVKDIARIENGAFKARGSTPLFDAMGRAIRDIDNQAQWGDKIVIATITDGYENASKEFNVESIKRLIAEKEATGYWSFVYIGANDNPFAVASQLGISHGNVQKFAHTRGGTQSMMAAMAVSTSAYAASHDNQTLSFYADADIDNTKVAGEDEEEVSVPTTVTRKVKSRRAGNSKTS